MSQTPEEIQRDIEAQRAHLSQTVDQLAAKLDVKSQAKAKVARVRDQATTADGKPKPAVLGGAGAALAVTVAVVVVLILRRRS